MKITEIIYMSLWFFILFLITIVVALLATNYLKYLLRKQSLTQKLHRQVVSFNLNQTQKNAICELLQTVYQIHIKHYESILSHSVLNKNSAVSLKVLQCHDLGIASYKIRLAVL